MKSAINMVLDSERTMTNTTSRLLNVKSGSQSTTIDNNAVRTWEIWRNFKACEGPKAVRAPLCE